MGTTYDATRRYEDKNGKARWDNAGYSVVKYDHEGEERFMLKDGRTGETFTLFPRKPRSDAGPETW